MKETPKDVDTASHSFLLRGGFIKESVAGRYYFLPMGYKVQQKIISIIREEMDEAGAQEMLVPILHPLELWEETNRTNTAGFELMKVKDRRGAEFALGGTAEEMFVDLVRKFKLSYRDLPMHLYQFSPKFRDEMRARGGLLRVREFIMKDGYSFDVDEEHFKVEYEKMKKVYTKIFKRLGLKTAVVESDNGYIGGEYCHEYIVESEAGESKYFTVEDGSYSAHEDVAKFKKHEEKNNSEQEKPREDVEGVGIIGVEELAKFLKIPAEKTTKTIIFENEKKEIIAAAVNGIYDINETKLKNILGCAQLSLASPERVREVTGAEVGYAGIINLPKDVRVIMDESLMGRKNFECGANKTNYHSLNINFGRDVQLPERFYDIALAKEGYLAPDGKQKLIGKKGIEVGNIFQLGYHYSKKMKGAVYVGADGKENPFYMGCYGIGVGRTLATIVEKYHDEKGIVWPKDIAPFMVHLICIKPDIKKNKATALKIYQELQKENIQVLYDDREDKSVGEKFAEADILGIPYRVVVSEKTLAKNSVELKERNKDFAKLVKIKDLKKSIKNA